MISTIPNIYQRMIYWASYNPFFILQYHLYTRNDNMISKTIPQNHNDLSPYMSRNSDIHLHNSRISSHPINLITNHPNNPTTITEHANDVAKINSIIFPTYMIKYPQLPHYSCSSHNQNNY